MANIDLQDSERNFVYFDDLAPRIQAGSNVIVKFTDENNVERIAEYFATVYREMFSGGYDNLQNYVYLFKSTNPTTKKTDVWELNYSQSMYSLVPSEIVIE